MRQHFAHLLSSQCAKILWKLAYHRLWTELVVYKEVVSGVISGTEDTGNKAYHLKKFHWSSPTAFPECWSGRSTTTYIVFDAHSLNWGFGKSCTIVPGITSEPDNACYLTYSTDIFVDLQSFGCNFKATLFNFPLWRIIGMWGSG